MSDNTNEPDSTEDEFDAITHEIQSEEMERALRAVVGKASTDMTREKLRTIVEEHGGWEKLAGLLTAEREKDPNKIVSTTDLNVDPELRAFLGKIRDAINEGKEPDAEDLMTSQFAIMPSEEQANTIRSWQQQNHFVDNLLDEEEKKGMPRSILSEEMQELLKQAEEGTASMTVDLFMRVMKESYYSKLEKLTGEKRQLADMYFDKGINDNNHPALDQSTLELGEKYVNQVCDEYFFADRLITGVEHVFRWHEDEIGMVNLDELMEGHLGRHIGSMMTTQFSFLAAAANAIINSMNESVSDPDPETNPLSILQLGLLNIWADGLMAGYYGGTRARECLLPHSGVVPPNGPTRESSDNPTD